jgi:hypothetical protein
MALFLDEPSSGLDVSTRRFLWDFIKFGFGIKGLEGWVCWVSWYTLAQNVTHVQSILRYYIFAHPTIVKCIQFVARDPCLARFHRRIAVHDV